MIDEWEARLAPRDMIEGAILGRLRGAARDIARNIAALPVDQQIAAINVVRYEIHQASPFRSEPIDFVYWAPADHVAANDYNPNAVAPPEMRLLERSIMEDGYTQPIVTHLDEDETEVVDGFHRTRIGKESKTIRAKLHGHLPTVGIRASQAGRSNRMASTIRHNRARGTHSIDLMKGIVAELVEAGMSDGWIMKHIGMDADELLRLKQITGLAALFADKEFSRAWVKDEKDAEFYGPANG